MKEAIKGVGPQRIVITGFMAAGKTTVAEALERRLGCRAVDLDTVIGEREERSAAALIEVDGEARLREVETEALGAILGEGGARVIALGGGAWTIPRNRDLIARHDCLTFWLDAPFRLCWQRIADGSEVRPLACAAEKARELYDQRLSLYALATFHVLATAERGVEDLASEILTCIPESIGQ